MIKGIKNQTIALYWTVTLNHAANYSHKIFRGNIILYPNFIVLIYWRETWQVPTYVAAHYCEIYSTKWTFLLSAVSQKNYYQQKKRKIQNIIMHYKTRIVASYWVQMYLGERKYLCNENRCNLKSNQHLVKLVQPVLILLRVLLRLRNFVVNWSASI